MVLSFLLAMLANVATAAVDYDVVVYGSSPAGIAAATAAGTLGMKVALYEPLKMIGGMGAAGNLALNDGGMAAERTGLAYNFSMRNAKYYNVSHEVPHPESFVANASFYQMLHDAKVKTIKLDCRLLSASTRMHDKDAKHGSVVDSVKLFCEPNPITATVFIDASYDGDIMVAAGNVDFTAGREATTTYNESLAGARVPGWVGVGGPQHVPALKDDGSILKYVSNISDLKPAGSADDALMAFQHRMCISGDDDRIPWPKPENYNADDFLLLLRAIESNGDRDVQFQWSANPGYPGTKKKYCLCCGISVAASDQPTLNAGWASASWERKQEIIADHTYFELGSFYFLSNDNRIPANISARYNAVGLCADEFQEFGHIPPQLYVRISNRLVGDYVMTQNNIATPWQNKTDSIAVGDWSFDEHMTGKYAVPFNGSYRVMLEGNFWPSITPGHGNWYDVPYKIMVPKRGTGGNLLVPVALSASAVAFSSTRIENMYMSVGTAAGVAAKQLVDGDVDVVQDVEVSQVQQILNSTFRQRIHGPPGHPSPPPSPPNADYYVVNGAGSSDWDGKYLPTDAATLEMFADLDAQQISDAPAESNADFGENGAAAGHTMYTNAACTAKLGTVCALYSWSGVWRLAELDKKLYYVAGTSSGSAPPLTGWTVAVGGAAPAPTLKAGPIGGE